MPTLLWCLLVAIVIAVLAVVGIPVWLVQPFAPQSPSGLTWSWTLRQAAPLVTALGLALSLPLVVALWRRAGPPPDTRTRWRRWVRRLASRHTALVLIAATLAATTWFARQNHFEWMFRPFPDPQFVDVDEVDDLQPGAPVIGVASTEAALAFPITRIGYHHLVNTTLGPAPIVATY
jgi:Protein of unknown function (DUF3179)